MAPHTRRRFLHVAAAAAAGLAGCGRLSGDGAQCTPTATPAARPNRSASGSWTVPPTVLVRAGTALPPIRLVDPDREETESPYPDRHHLRWGHAIVDTQSRAERLTVADGVEDGDANSVSSFVDATDFDSETLYLESNRVEECFRLKLCRVSWQPTEIDTDYTRQLRPYDERCDADEHVFESRLIRLPVTLDEEDVTSYGSSIGGSGRCEPTGTARAEGSSGGASSESNRESGAPTETVGQTTSGGEQ